MKNSPWLLLLLVLSVGLSTASLCVAGYQTNDNTLPANGDQPAESAANALRKDLEDIREVLETAFREIKDLRRLLAEAPVRPELDEETLKRFAKQLGSEIMVPLQVLCNGVTDPSTLVGLSGPDTDRRSRIAEIAQLKVDSIERSHRLWTMLMVATRYGLPDNVSVSDGLASWNYTWGNYFMSIRFSGDRAISTFLQKQR